MEARDAEIVEAMMVTKWMVVGLVLACMAPNSAIAQSRLTGPDRLLLRANMGTPGSDQLHYGIEADVGMTQRTSMVASIRRWRYDNYGCVRPGPVQGEPIVRNADPPCTPEGWAFSGGLRGTLSFLFAEADLGLYRYDNGQVFMAPYGGLRAGLAPSLGSALELQFALHLILISSYNSGGFDPNTWFLGSWDLGLGIPIP